MFSLYIDARNGGDLQSLVEIFSQLGHGELELKPFLKWLESFGLVLDRRNLSFNSLEPTIPWHDCPLSKRSVDKISQLLATKLFSYKEQLQMALSIAYMEAIGIEFFYISSLPAGTNPTTLRILTGNPVNFAPYEVSPSFALFVKEFGLILKNQDSLVLADFVQSTPPHNLTAYLCGPLQDKEEIFVLQFQVDDMSPELLGYLQEKAFELGALDYFLIPIQMKKNRPGFLVTILSHVEKKKGLVDLIFAETSTIGLRYHTESRYKAAREVVSVLTPYGEVKVKESSWLDSNGITHVQRSPEYEDCRRIAKEAGVALKTVYAAALKVPK